jgi:hypothetical protein
MEPIYRDPYGPRKETDSLEFFFKRKPHRHNKSGDIESGDLPHKFFELFPATFSKDASLGKVNAADGKNEYIGMLSRIGVGMETMDAKTFDKLDYLLLLEAEMAAENLISEKQSDLLQRTQTHVTLSENVQRNVNQEEKKGGGLLSKFFRKNPPQGTVIVK